jgi:Tfp pilus assembly protein PilP
LLKHEIIVPEELKSMRINYNHTKGVFELETFHVSLFRCKGLMDDKGGVVGLIKEANEELWGKNDEPKGSNS